MMIVKRTDVIALYVLTVALTAKATRILIANVGTKSDPRKVQRAMREYKFEPSFHVINTVSPTYPIADLEKECGVYSSTPSFVRKHCGDIAKLLLSKVPDAWYAETEKLKLYPNCDVRVHRLYPGDFPAYPGFHCDGEFRETYFSQPDLDRIAVSHHLTAHVSSHDGGVSCTQFLNQPFTVKIEQPDNEHTLWGQVHNALMKEQSLRLVDILDGEMVQFGSRSLHRAMPTKIRGWRLFFRMSGWHRKNLGDGGMLTKQEQVYKVVEGSGW